MSLEPIGSVKEIIFLNSYFTERQNESQITIPDFDESTQLFCEVSEAKGNGGRAEAANQSDFIFATRANVFRVVSDVYMLLFCGHTQSVVASH